MLSVTIRQLEVLDAVTKMGGFGLAASQLGISQASVTTHITALETQVGSPVFTRQPGKRPELTDVGETVVKYAKLICPHGRVRLECQCKGGLWNLEDSIALARELRLRDVDVVDCSSGGISGYSPMPIVPRIPGYQVEYARRIRHEAGVSTAAVGLITEPEQAERILQEGSADLVLLAREMMFNSEWPVHAARALGIAEWYDLFPPEFAHRLRRRDVVAAMDINRPENAFGQEEIRLIEST